MQSRMNLRITITLVSMLLLSTLTAVELDMSRPIGTRKESLHHHLEQQEKRLLEEEKQKNDSENHNIIKTLITTHPDVFQYPFWVSPLGDIVEFQNGTEWSVAYEDRLKTFDWMTSDKVVIIPNHSWFSSYHYRLKNMTNESNVRVNIAAPQLNKILYTHWIIQIDYKNNQLCLNDGSVWNISFWDGSVIEKWFVNDRIVMGCNDGWFSKSYPNILINLETLNHAISRSIH